MHLGFSIDFESDFGATLGDVGRILDGFCEDLGKIFEAFWKDQGEQTMIRATKGTSIDR